MIQRADVSDRRAVRKMFAAGVEAFGRVDILINSAGVNRDCSFMDIADDLWDDVMDSHLKGHFICGQEYVRANQTEKALLSIWCRCGSAAEERRELLRC